MSILLLGAYHKKTGVYTLPTKAIKTEEYSCPDCKKDLIICQGDIRVHYFRHTANDIRPCTYYDKPSESHIHHSAKLLLKELLLHSSVIICRSCPSCKTIEQYDIPICTDGSSIIIEHRFEYNGLKIADVAYLYHNEIVGIFEIYHTHKTDATNRPEPWFEIEATSLLSLEPDSIIRPTNILNRHLTTKKIEPSKNESSSTNKTEVSKMKCSICKQEGHNKRSCKMMTTPVSPQKVEAETDVKLGPQVEGKMTTISICTEENPQVNEVEFILKYLGVPCKVRNLTASVKGNIWDGTFLAETDNPSVNVVIILVKGSGSFVDYIVYDNVNPDEKTVPILLMESTKTTDSESRNTAINQRFTKFAVAKQRFPVTPLVLYYNTEQVTKTPTSLFGRRLLTTFGIKVYDVNGKDLLTYAPSFTSVEEIMKEKNAFKEKKGNVSVKITLNAPHTYTISAKLSKGKNTTICHDPNKGLITGIASAIYSLDKEAKFLITNHCVAVDQIKKTTDKFWYANSAYDLKLEGCNASSKGIACPAGYWSRDSKSEKASTINYQNHMEKNGWTTVYHNHSSSARSYFMDSQGKEHQVPKYLTIPDVVMVNKEKRCIQVCEGKILKDCFLGVKQLENLTNFLKYLETHYMGYTVERGLCLYGNTFREIESVKKQLSYPVFFAMDSTGTLYY